MYTRVKVPQLLAIRKQLLRKMQGSLASDNWTEYNQNLADALNVIKHYLNASVLEVETRELEKLERLANRL